jgi:TatD DNase family protein
LRINKKKFVGIGEIGLDYFWVKNKNQRENQKELFTQLISLAKQLELPLIIHSRDAYEDTIEILEQEQAKNVVMHMFGANKLTKRVIENNWRISMNSIVLKSKKHKKVVRDCPIHKLLIETDSPWLAPDSFVNKRNDPTSTSYIVKKVAEIKKTNFEEIDEITTKNAISFFQLKI